MQIGINLALTQRNGGAGAPALNIDFAGTGVLPSTVTFSRGTNATLTDSNGRIAWAPHNLLTNSEDFEAAAWVKASQISIDANVAVSPTETTTADKVRANTTLASSSAIYVSVTTTAVSYTYSIYAKADGANFLYLFWDNGSSDHGRYFDLVNGTVGNTVGTAVTSSAITSVGNGWYRCSITFTGIAATTYPAFLPSTTNATGRASQAGTTPNGILVWGAQLNVGSTAQSYNPTTPKNLLGFTQEPENAAWTKSNSYVQQNLLTWSQDFDNAAWTRGGGVTVSTNSTVAPDGSTTADTITHPAATGEILQNNSSGAINATSSFYVKYSNVQWIRPVCGSSTNNAAVWFDIQNGIVGGTAISGTAAIVGTPTITPVGNGWYRCVMTVAQVSVSGNYVQFNTADANNSNTRAIGSFFIWGAQLVQGSTAGDYTQTTSAAAPTRYVNWDGTLTGRKLVESATGGVHVVYASTAVAAVPYTLSMYAKPEERNFARLDFVTSSYAAGSTVILNLTTGVTTVTNYGATTGTTATAVSVGGGWYRLTMTVQATAATYFSQIGLSSTNSTGIYTGDGTSGIYVSDFQLSNSASVDPYVYNPQAAAASAAYYGPRFDYDPTGSPVLSGVELVNLSSLPTPTISDFGGSVGAWNASTRTMSNTVTGVNTQFPRFEFNLGLVTNSVYRVQGRLTGNLTSLDSVRLATGGAANNIAYNSTTGEFAATVVSAGASIQFLMNGAVTAPQSLTIAAMSIQLVTGYTATANGLLIEEQRTNLLLRSEDFSTTWTNVASSETVNVVIAPDGALTGSKLIEDATLSGHELRQTVTTTATATTFGVYAKAAERTWVVIAVSDSSGTTRRASFNLLTGQLGTVGTNLTGDIQNAGNGWYRCSITVNTAFAGTNTARIYTATADDTIVYTGDGTSGIFIWGAQLEAGSFPTSYIPTVASQVTRNADSASMLGDNFYTWFNASSGSFYAEADITGTPASSRMLEVHDGTDNNRLIFYAVNSASSIRFTGVAAGVTTEAVAASSLPTSGVPFKAAGAFTAGEYVVCYNGGTVGTAAPAALPTGLSAMVLGARRTGAQALNGHIRRINYYNTRLDNATLQALTT